MSLPCTPHVEIRLGAGASFGSVFVLGDTTDGILGTNVLGTSVTQLVDVSSTVQQISIRHGRDRMFEEYNPGEAIIQFIDFTGDWNPANVSGPYYGLILPMNQVRVTTDYDGTHYYLFTGYVTDWDYTWPDQSSPYAIVTIRAIDAFRLFALANVDTVAGSSPNQLPGERLNAILDEIGWPSEYRAIDEGDTLLDGDPGGIRSALAALHTIEQSDLGALFVDPNGNATYYSRVGLAERASGTPTYFDDNDVNVQYQAIDINYDDTQLANIVTFQRHGGSAQTASDPDSIDTYFSRSLYRSGLLMKTNADALAKAQTVLAYRKDPKLRIDSITLDLSSDTNRVEPGLSLDVGDPIVVTKNMANGSDLVLRITVQGVSHDISPDRWTTKFTTAYPLSTAFILGSSEFGILGTNTL
jgi:hypothetical protein